MIPSSESKGDTLYLTEPKQMPKLIRPTHGINIILLLQFVIKTVMLQSSSSCSLPNSCLKLLIHPQTSCVCVILEFPFISLSSVPASEISDSKTAHGMPGFPFLSPCPCLTCRWFTASRILIFLFKTGNIHKGWKVMIGLLSGEEEAGWKLCYGSQHRLHWQSVPNVPKKVPNVPDRYGEHYGEDKWLLKKPTFLPRELYHLHQLPFCF